MNKKTIYPFKNTLILRLDKKKHNHINVWYIKAAGYEVKSFTNKNKP